MPRRTTIEIDDALLDEAQNTLGTSGLKDTVEAAFRQAIRQGRRQRLLQRIVTGTGIDRSTELLGTTRPSP